MLSLCIVAHITENGCIVEPFPVPGLSVLLCLLLLFLSAEEAYATLACLLHTQLLLFHVRSLFSISVAESFFLFLY